MSKRSDIVQTDFHGFTETKNSDSRSTFQCNECGYTFGGEIVDKSPMREFYEKLKVTCQAHNGICKRGLLVRLKIFERIKQECTAQVVKFDEQGHHSLYWYAILGEEMGEVGKALVENDLESYEAELIQVAATCVSMIQSLHNPDLKWCEPKSLTHSTKRIKK